MLPSLIQRLLCSFEFSRAGQTSPGKPAEVKGEPVGVIHEKPELPNQPVSPTVVSLSLPLHCSGAGKNLENTC